MLIAKPLTGAVTLCQRYGSLLQFSPHFDSWLPDGVYVQADDGAVTFVRLEPPIDDDVERLLTRIARRVEALIAKTRRANNVRFHGVYAPNAKVRPALTALLPKLPLAETDKDDCAHGEEEARHGDAATTKGEPVPHKYRRTWHEFLRRVFDIN